MVNQLLLAGATNVRLLAPVPANAYDEASGLPLPLSVSNQRIVAVMIQSVRITLTRFLALFAVLSAAVFVSGCGVNNIPTFENAAKAQWSEVLNQYKRRSDLIPNLVETVKGFAEQEKSVLTDVIEARAKATQMQIPADILTNPEAMQKFQDAQNTLGGALGRLMAVIERYPDIKSGQNFLALQSELAGTENRIAIARRDYIESVRVYNTELTTIPGRWWKAFMYPDKKEMATFDIPAGEQNAPKVDFNKS
jgi:LemA protein